MGGTAIPGAHWVLLDLHREVHIKRVVIDWETAYADDYILEGRRNMTNEDKEREQLKWDLLYVGKPGKGSDRYVAGVASAAAVLITTCSC